MLAGNGRIFCVGHFFFAGLGYVNNAHKFLTLSRVGFHICQISIVIIHHVTGIGDLIFKIILFSHGSGFIHCYLPTL